MQPKFKVGDPVRTIKGSPFDIEGAVIAILEPTEAMMLLWSEYEIHYQIRDGRTGEYLNVIERGIERYEQAKRRRRTYSSSWK